MNTNQREIHQHVEYEPTTYKQFSCCSISESSYCWVWHEHLQGPWKRFVERIVIIDSSFPMTLCTVTSISWLIPIYSGGTNEKCHPRGMLPHGSKNAIWSYLNNILNWIFIAKWVGSDGSRSSHPKLPSSHSARTEATLCHKYLLWKLQEQRTAQNWNRNNQPVTYETWTWPVRHGRDDQHSWLSIWNHFTMVVEYFWEILNTLTLCPLLCKSNRLKN